jgi:hypothetical protein
MYLPTYPQGVYICGARMISAVLTPVGPPATNLGKNTPQRTQQITSPSAIDLPKHSLLRLSLWHLYGLASSS